MSFALLVTTIAITVVLILSNISFRRKTDYLLAGTIFTFAIVLIIVQFLSIFHILSTDAIIYSQIVLMGIAITVYFIKGRPRLFEPFRCEDIRNAWLGLKTDPGMLIWVSVGALGLILLGAITWLFLDNTGDSAIYHFSRIGIWLQNGTVFFTKDSAVNIVDERIVGTEAAGDMLYLWLFAGTHHLRYVNIIEWLALFPLMIAIYGLVKGITDKKKPAVLSAIFVLTFETVIWNVQHANAMITSTFMLLSGFYFFWLSTKEQKWQWVMLSCLGFAMALSAKATIYFIAPFLAIIIMIEIIRSYKVSGWKWIKIWIICGSICLSIFPAGILIQNISLYGGPIAINSAKDNQHISDTIPDAIHNGLINLPRYAYLAFQPDPLPVFMEESAQKFWVEGGQWLGINQTEFTRNDPLAVEWVGGNFLVPLLIIGGVLATVKKGFKGEDHWKAYIWLLMTGYLLLISATKDFHGPNFRYFVLPLSLFCVAIGDVIVVFERKRGVWLAFCLVSASITTAYVVEAFQQNFSSLADFHAAMRGEEREVGSIFDLILLPDTRILGFIPDRNTTSVKYFGEDLSREIEFTGCDSILNDLRDPTYDYFLFTAYSDEKLTTCLETYQQPSGENALRTALDNGYDLIYETWGEYHYWRLYQAKAAPHIVDDTLLYPMEFPAISPVIFISTTHQGQIGAGPVGYFIRNKGLESEEYLISLRSRYGNPDTVLIIDYYGVPCTEEGEIRVTMRDQLDRVTFNERVPVHNRGFNLPYGEMSYELALRLDLAQGINIISLDEPACDITGELPLSLTRVREVVDDVNHTGITLTDNWYGLEITPEGDSYRWVSNDASFDINPIESGEYVLMIGVQSGPGNKNEPFILELLDASGELIGEVEVTEDWDEVGIPFFVNTTGEFSLTLHTGSGGDLADNGDMRILNFLVTSLSITQQP